MSQRTAFGEAVYALYDAEHRKYRSFYDDVTHSDHGPIERFTPYLYHPSRRMISMDMIANIVRAVGDVTVEERHTLLVAASNTFAVRVRKGTTGRRFAMAYLVSCL